MISVIFDWKFPPVKCSLPSFLHKTTHSQEVVVVAVVVVEVVVVMLLNKLLLPLPDDEYMLFVFHFEPLEAFLGCITYRTEGGWGGG